MIAPAARWLRGAGAIARRELLSLLVTPLGYGVGALFLLLQGWDFALLLHVLNDPLAAPGPVMQFYFGGSFFVFWLPVIFTCAALTMRLVAEERRAGTLEAVLSAPVTPGQVVAGKYLAAVVYYLGLWLPTGLFVLLLRGAGARPDLGPIAAGYLGVSLVGALFLAVGLAWSAAVRHQLAAAVGTWVTCTLLVLAGLLVEHVPRGVAREVVERTSLLAMMQELAQGIVDASWPALVLAAVVPCLALARVLVDPRASMQGAVRVALVLVGCGFSAAWVSRHAPRADWTAGAVYSLSARAEAVLRTLRGPIRVDVLAPATLAANVPNPLRQELREVLRRMAQVSPALRVRVLDPDRDHEEAATLVQAFGLAPEELSEGVVLVQAGPAGARRRAHVLAGALASYATGADVQASGPRLAEFRGELALLRAMIEVDRPVRTTVCVTQGHGEPGLADLTPHGGYAHLARLLRNEHLEVRAAATARDLDGCDLVLVAGPTGPLPVPMVRALERRLDGDGRLLVFAGATIVRGRAGLAETGLEPGLARMGLRLGTRVVLDPHELPGSAPLLAFTAEGGWGDHPAVRALVGRALALVLVRELSVDAPAAGTAQAVLTSSEQAWAESDVGALAEGRPVALDPDADRAGPLPLIAVAERGAARVAVVASDQFALNAYLRPDVAYAHGRDLVRNLIGWLVDRPELAGIDPRPREHVKLMLRPAQLARMTWVALLGPAGFVIGVGLMVWFGRRRTRA